MSVRSSATPRRPGHGATTAQRASGAIARQSDPNEELRLVAEVRSMAHPEDYVIGGQVDHEHEAVVLIRGDFSQVVVPFAWFSATGAGLAPDFDALEILDTGETLRFGEYEVPVSAVLGQHDLRTLRGS